MTQLNRRQSLKQISGLAAAALTTGLPAPNGVCSPITKSKPTGMTFGFGTYGMQSLPLEEAITDVAKVGYDTVEICVRPEWKAAPEQISGPRRQMLKKLIEDQPLKISAFMEHVFPDADDAKERKVQERLKRVAEMGRQLLGDAPGVIQTVLGGGVWNQKKALFVDRLADWAEIGRQQDLTIAVKPHRGGAMSRPSEGVWLMKQLDGHPNLGLVYDYSHYIFRDMPLAATVKEAAPYLVHVAIKDARRDGQRVVFELPGEHGTIDYVELLRLLKSSGYQGDVCCEVSSMVWNRPGYDPKKAARTCYSNLAATFGKAGIDRPSNPS